MALNRCVVQWNGLQGLPGISVFYLRSAVTDVSDLVAFFNGVKGLFPNALTWTVPAQGDQIDEATGALVGGWAGTGGAQVQASGGVNASFAAGVGARVEWTSDTIVGRRRARGRTFLTSLTNGQYDPQGTILSTALSTIQTAATALVASDDTVIWHRPVGGSGGSLVDITGSLVPDTVTSLRTRRT